MLAPTADFRLIARAAARRGDHACPRPGRALALEIAHDAAAAAGGREAKEFDLDAIARQSATLAFTEGSIPAPVDGDFPAFGKAYRDLDDDEYARATSIALERHRALNWLCGYASDWDNVPTDT